MVVSYHNDRGEKKTISSFLIAFHQWYRSSSEWTDFGTLIVVCDLQEWTKGSTFTEIVYFKVFLCIRQEPDGENSRWKRDPFIFHWHVLYSISQLFVMSWCLVYWFSIWWHLKLARSATYTHTHTVLHTSAMDSNRDTIAEFHIVFRTKWSWQRQKFVYTEK